MNAGYRWVKFFINKEENVNVQTDAVISSENSGKITVELMTRSFRIIDESYPRFMHVIWGGE